MKPKVVCSDWGPGTVPALLTDSELEDLLHKRAQRDDAYSVMALAHAADANGSRLWGILEGFSKCRHSEISALIAPKYFPADCLFLLPAVCTTVKRLQELHRQRWAAGKPPEVLIAQLSIEWHLGDVQTIPFSREFAPC